jgi:hypothetical protein
LQCGHCDTLRAPRPARHPRARRTGNPHTPPPPPPPLPSQLCSWLRGGEACAATPRDWRACSSTGRGLSGVGMREDGSRWVQCVAHAGCDSAQGEWGGSSSEWAGTEIRRQAWSGSACWCGCICVGVPLDMRCRMRRGCDGYGVVGGGVAHRVLRNGGGGAAVRNTDSSRLTTSARDVCEGGGSAWEPPPPPPHILHITTI